MSRPSLGGVGPGARWATAYSVPSLGPGGLHPPQGGESLMLTGQRFKLRKSALAIEIVNGTRFQITIPTRTILKVIAGPIEGDPMVDVLWEGKRVGMFAVDLITRGTEIPGRKARAGNYRQQETA